MFPSQTTFKMTMMATWRQRWCWWLIWKYLSATKLKPRTAFCQLANEGCLDFFNSIVLAPIPSYLSWCFDFVSCFPQRPDISPDLRESDLVLCPHHPGCQGVSGARLHQAAININYPISHCSAPIDKQMLFGPLGQSACFDAGCFIEMATLYHQPHHQPMNTDSSAGENGFSPKNRQLWAIFINPDNSKA